MKVTKEAIYTSPLDATTSENEFEQIEQDIAIEKVKNHYLYTELCKENEYLSNTVADLKNTKFMKFNEDECWIYMEDDENNLDSLVCPVVIDPKVLMRLIGENEFKNNGLDDVNDTDVVEMAGACAYCGALVDDQVIKQDKPQEWDGNGLPPVGVLHEMRFKGWNESWANQEWCENLITAHGETMFLSKGIGDNSREGAAYYDQVEFRPLKTEPTVLQCEIDMINAYLEQIDSNISDYDVQMFAQYVLERLKESGNE